MPEVKRAVHHDHGPSLMTSQQRSTPSTSCRMASTTRSRSTPSPTGSPPDPRSPSARPSFHRPWPTLTPFLMRRTWPWSGRDLRAESTGTTSSGIRWAILKMYDKRSYLVWRMWQALSDRKYLFWLENFIRVSNTCSRSPTKRMRSGKLTTGSSTNYVIAVVIDVVSLKPCLIINLFWSSF